jgi:hypothetical protein
MKIQQVIDKAEFEPWMKPVLAKLLDKAEIARVEPILCGVEEAAVMIGRGTRFVYDGLARGLFQGKKSDGRTLLVVQSLKDYAAGLPAAKGTLNKIKRTRLPDGRLPRPRRAAAGG